MKVAYLTHPSSVRHDMGTYHPECPDRVTVIADRLLAMGLLDYVDAYEAPEVTCEQAVRAHTQLHWDQLHALAPASGLIPVDPDTFMGPETLPAALHAAGALVKAVDLVVGGQAQRAFCNVRPPGHHATRSEAGGFCFLNNVAIGVRHALDVHGLERVALIDFDVHHGNGSEDILAGDERVLMVSTFQSHLYPFSGDIPRGANMCNVPLAAYSDGQALRDAVEMRWLPALREFAPQMLFVSAGFDAHRDDEMSMLGWRDQDYAWVSRVLVDLADECCGGRIVSTLEGGYALPALARCVELHMRALLGID
ncbi:MAG: histone deacetylase family protein [Burkholderiaceae bacterium]